MSHMPAATVEAAGNQTSTLEATAGNAAGSNAAEVDSSNQHDSGFGGVGAFVSTADTAGAGNSLVKALAAATDASNFSNPNDSKDFGDFAALPAAGNAQSTAIEDSSSPAAIAPAKGAEAAGPGTTAPAAGGSIYDDDFGDFDAAASVSSAGLSTHAAANSSDSTINTLSNAAIGTDTAAYSANAAADCDDDFGDFGDASASTPPSLPVVAAARAAQPAAAPPAAVPASPSATGTAAVPGQPAATSTVPAAVAVQAATATAAPEPADILALSGGDFLAAVLDRWQVFGAPAAYKAAEAHQPSTTQPITVPLPAQMDHSAEPNSILAYGGIPMYTLTSSSTADSSSSSSKWQQCVPDVSCDANLQWQGSASEARLVAGLGLKQAV